MKQGFSDENCKFEQVGYERFEEFILMLGGKWKLRLLYFIADNTTMRYGELKKALKPITHKMLSIQLKELEQDGFITRKEFPQIPPKVEYTISEKGISLYPIFNEIAEWILGQE